MAVVGSVSYSVDGKQITSPLYLVQVGLKAGEILDTLAETKDAFAAMKIGPYLDFEFLGKLGGLERQSDRRHKPLPTSVSAVHVFGVTLERSPVELRLKQSQPGNIFHNDEVPETTFALHAEVAGRCALRWEIHDVAGKVSRPGDRTVAMKAGEDVDITVPLAMPELGWYGLRVALSDANGRVLFSHEAAFALLGKDTRTAGYESPFGTWWFGSAHYVTRDLSVIGPMMFKAGMRRTPVSWTKDTAADLAPWKISHDQIQWPFRLIDLENWPAAEARAEKVISGMLAVLMRRGFPRELMDYIGSETTGQSFAPEKLTPHTTGGIWLMGQTARKFGYDVPMTGCFEFTCRAERDLGPQRLAEWYAKDFLHGLANRFVTISPGVIEDVGNAYYQTLWGGSGFCERKGLLYPKPAYVAVATLTKVLDGVKLARQVDTGSSSAHALEFTRGSEHIYALWTARGECEMQFEFAADAAVTGVSFYGKPSAIKSSGKHFTVTAGTAVNYIVSPVAAARVRAGRRTFDPPPVGTKVVSRMDDIAQW